MQTVNVDHEALPLEQATDLFRPTSRSFELDDIHEAIEFYYEQGWTDGLPIVPPTPAKVSQFLQAGGKYPGDIIGMIPERNRVITAEKVAINAVMAGCMPDYMPVVFAAIEALCQEAFNYHGSSASTGGSAPLIIVNGPAVADLGINSGGNCFGPGVRANATIGRATRLVMVNAGGTIPGIVDRSVLGHPGKYTFCIGEDEAGNPWQPLSVERGIPAGTSAVTVFAAEAPHYVSSPASGEPLRLAEAISTNMLGTLYRSGCWVLVLCPEHVAVFKKAVWSKDDIRRAVQERTIRTVAGFKRLGGLPDADILPADEQTPFYYVPKLENLLIVTAGGMGNGISAVIPPWVGGASSMPVTRAVGVCIDC